MVTENRGLISRHTAPAVGLIQFTASLAVLRFWRVSQPAVRLTARSCQAPACGLWRSTNDSNSFCYHRAEAESEPSFSGKLALNTPPPRTLGRHLRKRITWSFSKAQNTSGASPLSLIDCLAVILPS